MCLSVNGNDEGGKGNCNNKDEAESLTKKNRRWHWWASVQRMWAANTNRKYNETPIAFFLKSVKEDERFARQIRIIHPKEI